MKTTHGHEFHGLTRRTDIAGWVIQVRFLGRYRQIRAYTEDNETAARRHDIALSKLESFAEVSAHPNFPTDFSTIRTGRDADNSEGYQKFWDDLHGLFNQLHAEAESQGLDPDAALQRRRELVEKNQRDQLLATTMARAVLESAVLRLVAVKLPACRFSSDDNSRVRMKLLDVVAALREVK